MGKKTGQGLSGELAAMIEFGSRDRCDLCRVTVFVREFRDVEGVIPRHHRLKRVVPERRYMNVWSLRCCRRCCRYLDALKKERFEQERQARFLQLERDVAVQANKMRIPFLLRIDCIDCEGTKAALLQRYSDRVRIEESSPNVLRVELEALGWWSWLSVEQGGDQLFFEEILKRQGLILTFQKFPFPADDRGLVPCERFL